MARFVVTTREIWYASFGVDAKDEQEAIDLVQNGEGDQLDNTSEYSHTIAPGETYKCEAWDVEEED